jgi:hypothetical protein
MNNITNQILSRMSAARRNAESLMPRTPRQTDESTLKQEQERKRMAIAAKTERLRELRLAKEAAEKAAGLIPVQAQKQRAARNKACSKQLKRDPAALR